MKRHILSYPKIIVSKNPPGGWGGGGGGRVTIPGPWTIIFQVDGRKTEKAREPTVGGARNLEAESIRSGAESTGGRVKLKTVTEIRW